MNELILKKFSFKRLKDTCLGVYCHDIHKLAKEMGCKLELFEYHQKPDDNIEVGIRGKEIDLENFKVIFKAYE